MRFSGLVEIQPSFNPRPGITHVLFDFDGTISMIRRGWPDVMVPMFEEFLPPHIDDDPVAVRKLLLTDILTLNGKQTIYQMMKFAERVTERGGTPKEPLWYKHEYLRRLNQKIESRLHGLESGERPAEEHLLTGSIDLLENLKRRGLQLVLASGTDEPFVKHEARLLGVDHYFGAHIHGAKDDYKTFSKKMIIDRILSENQIPGQQLLAFGDGYVEIENTKAVGGLAIGVPSDENTPGSGRMDPWKRERLLGVGADILVPDYRDAEALLDTILGT